MRPTGWDINEYDLYIYSPLPKGDANKVRLVSVLSPFAVGVNLKMKIQNDCAFGHEEAYITMMSSITETANHG